MEINKQNTIKYFLVVLLFISCNSSWSQKSPCILLQIIVNDDYCKRTFQLDSHSGAIVFVDKTKNFDSCSLDSVYKRKVYLTHDSSLEKENMSNIYIEKFEIKDSIYKIYLFQRLSQGTGYLEIKKKDGKYFIIKRAIGYF